jgi:Fe-S cluster biogenesis protein NfuA
MSRTNRCSEFTVHKRFVSPFSPSDVEHNMNVGGLGPKQMARIEELVHEIETLPDAKSRETAAEMVQLLMEFYGQGLARMLAIAGSAEAPVVDSYGQDPLVSQILMLHGLHPVDLPARIEKALEKVRPLLHSHGGDVELLGIENGLVRLRLEGSCHGCPSSTMTLKNAIQEAIYEFAPDVGGLDVAGLAGPSPPAGFVPLEAVALR